MDRNPRQVGSIAFISASAYSLINFKGALIESFVSAGTKVTAFAPDYDPTTREAVRALGAVPLPLKLNRSSLSPLILLIEVVHLSKVLRRDRPDAVFVCFVRPVTIAIFAAWLAGVPFRFSSIEGLGYLFSDTGKRSAKMYILREILRIILHFVLYISTKTFFFNHDDPEVVVGRGWKRRSDVVYVPGGAGLDLSRFSQAALPDQTTFIFSGRLLPEKGVREYVEAARVVKRIDESVRFLIVGGPDRAERSVPPETIKVWESEGVVELIGHVDDVRPQIEQASVLVLPSYREGLPRSIQEAMAMGRAIITSKVAGCQELVQQGRNGFLIPPRDFRCLARAMLTFVNEPSRAATMGAESRLMACDNFDQRAIARFVMGHVLEEWARESFAN